MCMQNLTVLQERCKDPALSVRKQALQSLTDLLDNLPQNKVIQRCVSCSYLHAGFILVLGERASQISVGITDICASPICL